jgi:hypothetical protein
VGEVMLAGDVESIFWRESVNPWLGGREGGDVRREMTTQSRILAGSSDAPRRAEETLALGCPIPHAVACHVHKPLPI